MPLLEICIITLPRAEDIGLVLIWIFRINPIRHCEALKKPKQSKKNNTTNSNLEFKKLVLDSKIELESILDLKKMWIAMQG